MPSTQTFPETKTDEVPRRKESMSRYRKSNRRVDYYMSEPAAKELDRVRALNPRHSIGALIDYLILKACKSVSGNEPK